MNFNGYSNEITRDQKQKSIDNNASDTDAKFSMQQQSTYQAISNKVIICVDYN
jgi:hypothetical protein